MEVALGREKTKAFTSYVALTLYSIFIKGLLSRDDGIREIAKLLGLLVGGPKYYG